MQVFPCAGEVRQKRSLEQCRAGGGTKGRTQSPGKASGGWGWAVLWMHTIQACLYACKQVAGGGREAGGAAGVWLGKVGGAGRDGGGAGQCCNEGRRMLIAERGDRKVFAIHCSLVVCGKGQEHRCTDTESEGVEKASRTGGVGSGAAKPCGWELQPN